MPGFPGASKLVGMTNAIELADRYVALWNEPAADRRRGAVAALWTEDGLHEVEPPEELRQAAAGAGLGLTARLQARGHAELEARARSAYDRFVASGDYCFRRQNNVASLGDVVKFNWEMVDRSGEVAAVGLEFLVLAPDGRIQTDYQFIER